MCATTISLFAERSAYRMRSLQTLREERTCAITRAGERMRRRREEETGAEREQRLRTNKERMRTTRAKLRCEADAEGTAVRETQLLPKRRGEETEVERAVRRRVDREHGRSVRQNVASMSSAESMQENYLGLMNKKCGFCHALMRSFSRARWEETCVESMFAATMGQCSLLTDLAITLISFSSFLLATPNVQRTSAVIFGDLMLL
ncbi:hypothetical protein M514_12743 [Trichuris suis]|uniref:Uncharacterized protein n=1 Tax=Trichuris suis TaxID=68888 RepID=A0A085N6C2_9BILA|nr:hypothetical protein M513_12743 [Trichuris suis]KFD65018.1 hypothetical protein M514_12743 [Trichuris suis]